MKQTNRRSPAGLVLIATAVVLILGISLVVPAFSATLTGMGGLGVLATTPTPHPGDVIPLASMAGLTSLNATVQLQVNGLINGQRAQGDLNARLATNDQGASRITVTGSLLGEIAAQVGGSLVGLFTPSSVDIYKVPEGTYIVVNSLIPVCVKPASLNATAPLDEMSPANLLSMLTSSDVARGKLIGQETLNGKTVKHYVLNGDAFLAAAQTSTDPKLQAFGQSLWSAEDADLFVDVKTGLPVGFRGIYSGAYEPLQFEGDFAVQIDLTGVNTNPPVALPSSCANPISR